jgi:hypothetical protein
MSDDDPMSDDPMSDDPVSDDDPGGRAGGERRSNGNYK